MTRLKTTSLLALLILCRPGPADAATFEKKKISGMSVAAWLPDPSSYPAPLILYSHGYHGINVQCAFAKKEMAKHGYIVLAPNHIDALGAPGSVSLNPLFARTDKWSERTFENRVDDIKKLIEFLKTDPQWKDKIDWNRVGLCGTSLGGYTALGLAGAWSEQKIPEAKAVLAQVPYTKPLVDKKLLENIDIPVMYQGGSMDFLTPEVVRKGGAYDQTHSPVHYVEFKRATHIFWSSLNLSKKRKEEMCYYNLAFFDKYLKGVDDGRLEKKLKNVSIIKSKPNSLKSKSMPVKNESMSVNSTSMSVKKTAKI